jgi:nucleotide-binding universal stress UspA family protein
VIDQRLDGESRAALRRYLDETRDRLGAGAYGELAVAGDALVLDGSPAEALAGHAQRTAPDLVVLATHGRGGVSRWWHGSVTDALLRHLAVPLLVVRPRTGQLVPGAGAAFRRVLLALDGTPDGEAAIEPALALGRRAGGADAADYALLHVISPFYPGLRPVEMEVERSLLEEQHRIQEYLADVAARIEAGGSRVRTTVRVAEDTAAAIVAYAAEIGADLVSVATHGRGPVDRLLVGSVADEILRTAHVPVLVCPIRASTARGGDAPAGAPARSTPAAAETGASRSRWTSRRRRDARPSGCRVSCPTRS